MFGFGKKMENPYEGLAAEQGEALEMNKNYDQLSEQLKNADPKLAESARKEMKKILGEALQDAKPEEIGEEMKKSLEGIMEVISTGSLASLPLEAREANFWEKIGKSFPEFKKIAAVGLAVFGFVLPSTKSEGASAESRQGLAHGQYAEKIEKGPLEKDYMHWPIFMSPHFDLEGIKAGRVSPAEIGKFILEPAAVTFRRTGELKGSIDADNIFQEYARKFDLARSLSPEDFEKTSKALEKELMEQLVAKCIGLSWDKAAFEKKYPEYAAGKKDLRATAVRIFGTASPEGPAQRGPETLEPGNIDSENIKLAELRALEAKRSLLDVFDRLGITYEENKITTSGSEPQFSPEERAALERLAKEYGKSEFEMIVDFNDGKLKETPTGNDLEVLLGEKRNASIEVDIEGGKKETLTIPLPFLLLLLLRRRRPEDEPPVIDPPIPEEPEGPEVVDYDMLKEENRWLYEELAKEMSKISDSEILDREKSIGHIGKIATLWTQWREIKMKDIGAGTLVEKIFEKWNWLDNEKRTRTGEAHEDHRDRPHQWTWAILHAVAERRLILEQRSNPKRSLAETLADSEVQEMMIEDISDAINMSPELKEMVKKVRSGEWK